MQQQIASIREEVNKKEQALRSITGKVSTPDTAFTRNEHVTCSGTCS